MTTTDTMQWLDEISQGDRRHADQLFTCVYDELKIIAARQLAHETPGNTLQPYLTAAALVSTPTRHLGVGPAKKKCRAVKREQLGWMVDTHPILMERRCALEYADSARTPWPNTV